MLYIYIFLNGENNKENRCGLILPQQTFIGIDGIGRQNTTNQSYMRLVGNKYNGSSLVHIEGH